MAFGGIHFGSCAALCHNDIHNKMANLEMGKAKLYVNDDEKRD